MAPTLTTPDGDGLRAVVNSLRSWQHDQSPIQLHPGDLGWAWQVGPGRLATSLRVWSRAGEILAVGLLDGPRLARLAIAPEAADDTELAEQMVADLAHPERGILPENAVSVEARFGAALRSELARQGWQADELWTPLVRGLTAPVEDCGLRIEVVGPELIGTRVALQNASFEDSNFTEARWHAMAAGLPYAEAHCLVGYDRQGNATSAVTVGSAGTGRPGLIEPLGVHHAHRGQGHGRAITVAAAATLREMGASTATVCTPSSNAGAVAAYAAAGFRAFPEVADYCRPASTDPA